MLVIRSICNTVTGTHVTVRAGLQGWLGGNYVHGPGRCRRELSGNAHCVPLAVSVCMYMRVCAHVGAFVRACVSEQKCVQFIQNYADCVVCVYVCSANTELQWVASALFHFVPAACGFLCAKHVCGRGGGELPQVSRESREGGERKACCQEGSQHGEEAQQSVYSVTLHIVCSLTYIPYSNTEYQQLYNAIVVICLNKEYSNCYENITL